MSLTTANIRVLHDQGSHLSCIGSGWPRCFEWGISNLSMSIGTYKSVACALTVIEIFSFWVLFVPLLFSAPPLDHRGHISQEFQFCICWKSRFSFKSRMHSWFKDCQAQQNKWKNKETINPYRIICNLRKKCQKSNFNQNLINASVSLNPTINKCYFKSSTRLSDLQYYSNHIDSSILELQLNCIEHKYEISCQK